MGFRDLIARVRGNTPLVKASGAEEARATPTPAAPVTPIPPPAREPSFRILPPGEPPTDAYLADEAWHAYQLLQRAAETRNPTEAISNIKEFATLVKTSPQAEMYDLQGIQEAFAEHVVKTIAEKHAGSLTATPSPGVPSLEIMVEKVVRNLKYIDSTQCSDLLDLQATTEFAMTRAYEHILKRLALIVAENIGNIAKIAIPSLVEDYEQTRAKYGEHVNEGPLPEIEFQQRGEQKKRSTDRVVYRGANLYYINLAGHLVENAHPLNARVDGFSAEIEGILERVSSYVSRCEYTPEEQEALHLKIASIGETHGQKVQQGNEMAETIEARHDQLYDRFNEASSLYRAQILFDHFTRMSTEYSSILGIEDLKPIVEQGRRKLAQFDATLDEEDDGRFIIRKGGEEDYVLAIRKTVRPPEPRVLASPPSIVGYDTFSLLQSE